LSHSCQPHFTILKSGFFCDVIYDLSWRMLHVLFRRMCILKLLWQCSINVH
jgi:hypothetical protein